jgi:LacI family transcriptional regulator
MKKVTMQDIADYLNISKNSVSLALRNKEGVSFETQKKVKEAALKLGYLYPDLDNYVPLIPAKYLLVASSFALSQTSFFGEIVKHLEAELSAENGDLIIHEVVDVNDLVSLDFVEFDEYRGVFILSHISNAFIDKILKLHDACVLIDHHNPFLETDTIVTQNINGAFLAVDKLIKLGHKKIGFIGDTEFSPSYMERYLGYKQALSAANIPLVNDYVYASIKENQHTLYNKLETITDMPSAWFCVNSGIAFILNSFLHSKGYSVPEDISIICFDDTEFSRMANPPITCLSTDLSTLAAEAFELLKRRINHPDKKIIEISIRPDIIERKSVNSFPLDNNTLPK